MSGGPSTRKRPLRHAGAASARTQNEPRRPVARATASSIDAFIRSATPLDTGVELGSQRGAQSRAHEWQKPCRLCARRAIDYHTQGPQVSRLLSHISQMEEAKPSFGRCIVPSGAGLQAISEPCDRERLACPVPLLAQLPPGHTPEHVLADHMAAAFIEPVTWQEVPKRGHGPLLG